MVKQAWNVSQSSEQQMNKKQQQQKNISVRHLWHRGVLGRALSSRAEGVWQCWSNGSGQAWGWWRWQWQWQAPLISSWKTSDRSISWPKKRFSFSLSHSLFSLGSCLSWLCWLPRRGCSRDCVTRSHRSQVLRCPRPPAFRGLGSELTVAGIPCVSKNTVNIEYFKTEPGIFLPFFQCKLLNPLSHKAIFWYKVNTKTSLI